jgi:hypothetical protein
MNQGLRARYFRSDLNLTRETQTRQLPSQMRHRRDSSDMDAVRRDLGAVAMRRDLR